MGSGHNDGRHPRGLTCRRRSQNSSKRQFGVLTAVAAVGMALLVPRGPAGAGTPTPGNQGACKPTHPTATINILTPLPGSNIDLAKTPAFSIAGTTSHNVTAVKLIADGRTIGSATPSTTDDRHHEDKKNNHWTFSTSAPSGKHTVVACAMNEHDAVGAATVSFTVTTPDPAAAVVSPNVVTLSTQDSAAIVQVNNKGVRFSRVPNIKVGNVLTAYATPKIPNGLLRRAIAIQRSGSGVLVSTIPATFDDVFYQVDIQWNNVPLQAAPSPAAPSVPSSAQPNANAPVKIPFPTLTASQDISLTESTCRTTPSCKWSGTFKATIQDSVSIQLGLDFHLVVKTQWNWGIPTPNVTDFRFGITGVKKQTQSLTLTGSGTFTYTNELVPKTRLTALPILIWDLPPIYLQPFWSAEATLKASVNVSTTITSGSITNFEYGAEYRDGKTTPFKTSATQALPTNVSASGGASFSVEIEPSVGVYVESLAGPSVGLNVGFEGSITYPCPGSLQIDAFVEAVISFTASVFGHNLFDASFSVAKVTFDLGSGPLRDATAHQRLRRSRYSRQGRWEHSPTNSSHTPSR